MIPMKPNKNMGISELMRFGLTRNGAAAYMHGVFLIKTLPEFVMIDRWGGELIRRGTREWLLSQAITYEWEVIELGSVPDDGGKV